MSAIKNVSKHSNYEDIFENVSESKNGLYFKPP